VLSVGPVVRSASNNVYALMTAGRGGYDYPRGTMSPRGPKTKRFMLEQLRLAVTFVLVGGLAPWVVSNLAEILRTGVASLRQRTYSELHTPVRFWLTVIGHLVIVLGCLYVLVRVVASWSV